VKKTMPDDTKILIRALTAYCRAARERLPDLPTGPSGVYELDGLKYAVLANADRILAVYRWLPRGQLKHLTRWPAKLERAAGFGKAA
jgi:hypothetical protein